MNMTEKNGQPSMEEILASIRRIIAEEPSGHSSHGELRGTPIMLKGDGVLDDAGDFDLPAIFRSSPPPASDRTPLLGRLTDAIRGATASQPEGRGVFNGDDDFSRSTPVEGGSLSAESGSPNPGLSSLKSARPSEPVSSEPHINGALNGAPAAPVSQSAAVSAIAPSSSAGVETPKRVMSPFKDTHFLRMTEPMAAVAPPVSPVAEVAPVVQPMPEPETGTSVDFRAIIPGQFDRTALVSNVPIAPSQFTVTETREEPYVSIPTSAAPLVVATAPPPPLPSSVPSHEAVSAAPSSSEESGSIEDTTADLLRPMLRQWLADNMPRMVEKALHIEIAESVKAPRKP